MLGHRRSRCVIPAKAPYDAVNGGDGDGETVFRTIFSNGNPVYAVCDTLSSGHCARVLHVLLCSARVRSFEAVATAAAAAARGKSSACELRAQKSYCSPRPPGSPSTPASACFHNGRCAVDANKIETHMHAIQHRAPPAFAPMHLYVAVSLFFSNAIPVLLTAAAAARWYSIFFFLVVEEMGTGKFPPSQYITNTFCYKPLRGNSS